MKAINIIQDINDQVNDFIFALLRANGEAITVREKYLTLAGKMTCVKKVFSHNGEILIGQKNTNATVKYTDLSLDEKVNLINVLDEYAKNEARKTYFEITSVAREDVARFGYDEDRLEDADMERLSRKMCSAYLENEYWIELKIIAEEMGFLKKDEQEQIDDNDYEE